MHKYYRNLIVINSKGKYDFSFLEKYYDEIRYYDDIDHEDADYIAHGRNDILYFDPDPLLLAEIVKVASYIYARVEKAIVDEYGDEFEDDLISPHVASIAVVINGRLENIPLGPLCNEFPIAAPTSDEWFQIQNTIREVVGDPRRWVYINEICVDLVE